MSEWISVKERLPETGAACWVVWQGHVQLIAYRRVGMGFACADGYIWDAGYDMGCEGIPDDQITHWQPMPEPPATRADSAP